MHLLFIQFIYSSLLFKTDLFYSKRPGKDEIKPGDNEKNISCLFFVQNKRLRLFFFFKIKKIILWSSIIGQSYFEQFDVISTSLKETKGKVRGKGKGSFDKFCQPLGPESEASCFYHVSENSGKKCTAINGTILLLFHSYLP